MPGLRTTYTYVELEVSAAAYDEIANKLRAADYDHALHDHTIDMHGIGLTKAAPATQPRDASVHTQEVFYNKFGSTGAVVCSCGFAVTFTNIGTNPEREGRRFFAARHQRTSPDARPQQS
jgi:hypothetical protein